MAIEGVKGLEILNGIYHYRRMFKGKREQKSLETANKAVAIKAALEINQKIESGVAPKLAIYGDTFDFAHTAQSYLDSRDLRPKSLQRYQGIIERVTIAFEAITGKPVTKLSEVTRQLIEDYCNHRKNVMISRNGHENSKKTKGVSAKTLNTEVQLIKGILKYAVEREWLAKEPNLTKVAPVKRRRGQASEIARPLNEEEVDKLLKSAKEYDQAHIGWYAYSNMFECIFTMYLYTGLRHEEGQYLEWTDIDFTNDIIKVRKKHVVCKRTLQLTQKGWDFIQPHINPDHNKQAFKDDKALLDKLGYKVGIRAHDKLLSIKGKDFNPETLTLEYTEEEDWQAKASEGDVPLHPSLKIMFQELQKQRLSNFVFPDTNGGYWRFDLLDRLNVIAKAAGITDNIRVHDLRHTFATTLRRKGVGIETLKELLRHSSIVETMIYAHYSQEEGIKAVKLLPDSLTTR